MQRRTMVQLMGAAAVGTLTPGLARFRRRGKLPPAGIQLYSVREAMKADTIGTLERLAGLGYREVEFAGYFDHDPASLRAALDRYGLAAPSAHVALEALEDDFDSVAGPARILGHDWLVVPWLDAALRTPSNWHDVTARFNRLGRRARDAGFRFAYHNHDFEFAPSAGAEESFFDVLVGETDPDLVSFELDIYWAVKGGRDPVDLVRAHPARYLMLHVKDSAGPPEHRMVNVGKGTIDFMAVLEAAGSVQHAFLEHDEPADAWAFARQGMTWYHSRRNSR